MEDKVIIRFKTTATRDKYWSLLTKGTGLECDDCPGGYTVSNAGFKYLGVFCERVTLYY